MVIRLGVEIALLLHVVIALLASGHAVLSNRETRGATGRVGVIWLAPGWPRHVHWGIRPRECMGDRHDRIGNPQNRYP